MTHEALYTIHFIMLQHAIPRPLNETQHLYETNCDSRQYGILLWIWGYKAVDLGS